MVHRSTLSEHHVAHALEYQEFPGEVIHSAPLVAVILTQSWCPQWKAMRAWLGKLEESRDPADKQNIAVWELEYDNKPFFSQFLQLKEKVWRNRLVPYVRYYRAGTLFDSTNYLSADRFLSKLRQGG